MLTFFTTSLLLLSAGVAFATNPCPRDFTGHAAVPDSDCTRYVQCVDGRKVAGPLRCPRGTLFDPRYQYCNWDYQVETCGGEDLLRFSCPDGETGIFPYNRCEKYYKCVDGDVRSPLYTCPRGTLFNVDRQYCDWDYNVNDDTCTTARMATKIRKRVRSAIP
jgi:hypothetical protein